MQTQLTIINTKQTTIFKPWIPWIIIYIKWNAKNMYLNAYNIEQNIFQQKGRKGLAPGTMLVFVTVTQRRILSNICEKMKKLKVVWDRFYSLYKK